METIGVRPLGDQMDRVLMRVREDREVMDITDGDGGLVLSLPAVESDDQHGLAEWWNRHDVLVEEIDKNRPEGVSAAEAIVDVRREL